MDRTSRHLLALVVIVAILAVSVATVVTAPFSMVSGQNTTYGEIYEADTNAGAIFSIADGSILTKNESIIFRAHFSGPANTMILPGGGLCNVTYKASWENQYRTIYQWSYNSLYNREDDDPNSHFLFSYTVDLRNAPLGPQQIEVTASGVGYLFGLSSWYIYFGSGSSSIHFIVAADPPAIDVVSPENKEYNNDNIPLVFYTEEETPWLGYNLDNLANVTVNGNTTLTGLSDGYHSITVYANGTKWNAGKSSDVLFKVNAQPGGNNSIPTSFWKTSVIWKLSETPARDQWEIDIQSKSRSWTTPVFFNGKVYAGAKFHVYVSQYLSYEWVEVYAFNAANGAEIWDYKIDSSSQTSPLAVVNGVVYFGSDENKVYALDASSGILLWNATIANIGRSSPAVVNNVVYIGGYNIDDRNGMLYALNAANGDIIWNVTIGSNIAWSSPVITNGVVYVGSFDGMYALDAVTGEKIWSNNAGDFHPGPPVANGVVYAMTSGANLYAFDVVNGTKIWNYSSGNVWGVSPVAVRNDMVYASYGAWPSQLYALNVKNGAKLWSLPLGNRISPPKIVDNVVCLSSDTSLLALNADTGRILWNYTTGVGLGEPVVVNGIAYLSAGDQIYAIGLPSELRPINEPFPVLLVAVLVVAVAVSAGLLLYYKKRKH
jgi:outer membrane protein assembly factor BamB